MPSACQRARLPQTPQKVRDQRTRGHRPPLHTHMHTHFSREWEGEGDPTPVPPQTPLLIPGLEGLSVLSVQNRVKNTSAEEQNVSSGPLPASTLLDGKIGTAGDSDGNPSPRTGRTTAAKISRVGTGLPPPHTHTQGSPQFCCTQMCFRGWGQSGQRPRVTVYPSGGEAWARGSPPPEPPLQARMENRPTSQA